MKEPHLFHPGMLALCGISCYQKLIEWVAHKLPFQCLVCKIAQDIMVGDLVSLPVMACTDVKWQTDPCF